VGVLDIEADHVDALMRRPFHLSNSGRSACHCHRKCPLYAQAEELATMKERQRLARDLHDAGQSNPFFSQFDLGILPRLWNAILKKPVAFGRNPATHPRRTG